MGKRKQEVKYYSLEKIKKYGAQYNVIFGKRSNGKTYATLADGLRRYKEDGKEIAYIRRWDDDLRGKRGNTLFEPLVANGLISDATGGEYDDVYYYGRSWYFCRWEESGGQRTRVKADKPFCYGFALNTMEHDKSSSYPRVSTIIFDECLTRGMYLADEFIIFMNVISTIARTRDDIVIYMVGNSVNKYCPYFAEMGLKNVKTQQIGTIDLYRYGDSELKVAVEYVPASTGSTENGNILFAFNNPKLQMITTGTWEIDIYPHLEFTYKPHNVIYQYFIHFDGETLHCEVIRGAYDDKGNERKNIRFTYIHEKTSDIKDPDNDVIFSPHVDARPNYYTNLLAPVDPRTRKIAEYFKKEKVFYQNNEVGEIVNNYLKYCRT